MRSGDPRTPDPGLIFLSRMVDWVQVVHPTQHKIGQFGDILLSSTRAVMQIVSEVSRIVKLSVQWSSDDFAAASRNSRKNLCSVLKIDVVCLHLFCEHAKTIERLVFDGEKMKIMHFKVTSISNTEFKKRWLVNFSFADMFVFVYTHRMPIFRTLLLLLFSIQWLSADFAAASKKLLTVLSGHAVNLRQRKSASIVLVSELPQLKCQSAIQL